MRRIVSTKAGLRLRLPLFGLSICFVILAAATLGSALWAQDTPEVKSGTIIATDYADLNAAVDAARRLRVGRIFMPAGKYYVNKTLNLTDWFCSDPPDPNNPTGKPVRQLSSLVLEGTGASTVIEGNTGNDPVIDMTGSARMILRNFTVQTPLKDNKWQPGGSVGILMARKAVTEGGPASAGHHSLEYVVIQGNYSVADAMSYCSEENVYYRCVFINEGGDAFIFSGENKEGVTSPYQKLQGSTCVVGTFYFGWFWSGKKDSVGLRVTSGGELYLYGGFFATYGETFSAIYLDGTRYCGKIRLSSVRQEGISGHGIYAVGSVSDVVVDGCTLGSKNAEAIHFEETSPNSEGPHKFVCRPDQRSRAFNWEVTGSSFNSVFEADPGVKYDPKKPLVEGQTTLRFESLQDSRIQNNSYPTYRGRPGVEPPAAPYEQPVYTDGPVVVVEKYSRRNYFELPSREALDLRGDAKSNTLVALADDLSQKTTPLWQTMRTDEAAGTQQYYDGRKRTYVDPDSSGSLMNFGLVNVYKLSKPRKGDFAMHDGTGFADRKVRLAVFDGKDWVFFDPSPQKK